MVPSLFIQQTGHERRIQIRGTERVSTRGVLDTRILAISSEFARAFNAKEVHCLLSVTHSSLPSLDVVGVRNQGLSARLA